MMRYSHLSDAEHVTAHSDKHLVYMRELLRRGPVKHTKMWEDIHRELLTMCNEFLRPVEGSDLKKEER